jgi:D-alanyl-D-alanine carboxypeptidase
VPAVVDRATFQAELDGLRFGAGGEQAAKADLDAALKMSFKESDAPGLVAAVQTPQYTWVQAQGVADRASGEPMTSEVHHRIGSVTKTFTAPLLLEAADEGLLSLDDTIDEHVKGVPNGDEITLRQMADMTSGVASYTEDEQWAKEWLSDPTRVWKPEDLARIGIKGSPGETRERLYKQVETLQGKLTRVEEHYFDDVIDRERFDSKKKEIDEGSRPSKVSWTRSRT